jgi:tetratricopeptide (TPR) repeat protein
VRFLASYFFDTSAHINTLYFRRDDVYEEYWTLEDVPGPRLAGVPLFILTDEDVFSAGEAFTYALQALGRATVIGEPTRGGAHITRAFRIGHRFEARIPWGRAINPTTGTNWEGRGITPDVQVSSRDALDTALDLARDAADLHRASREAQDVEALDDLMASLLTAEELFAQADMDAARSATRDAIERGMLAGILNEGSIDDLGNRFLQRGAVDMAVEVLTLNTVLHPDSEWAHYSLAEALVQSGEEERAKESLFRCLQLNPRNAWATRSLESI